MPALIDESVNRVCLEGITITPDVGGGGSLLTFIERQPNHNRKMVEHSSPFHHEDVFFHLMECGLLDGMYVWYWESPLCPGYHCCHYSGAFTVYWPCAQDVMLGVVSGDHLTPAPWFVVETWRSAKLDCPLDLEKRDPIADDTPL